MVFCTQGPDKFIGRLQKSRKGPQGYHQPRECQGQRPEGPTELLPPSWCHLAGYLQKKLRTTRGIPVLGGHCLLQLNEFACLIGVCLSLLSIITPFDNHRV